MITYDCMRKHWLCLLNMCVRERDREKDWERVRTVTHGLFHSQNVWTSLVTEKDHLNLTQVCEWDRDGLAGQTYSIIGLIHPHLLPLSNFHFPWELHRTLSDRPGSYPFAAAAAAAKSLQPCPTLCDPIDGSPPGSPVPGILQARILEWVAISFSKLSL